METIAYEALSEKYQQFILPTYGLPELLLVKGEGSWVTDDRDRRFLDFSSGISVCNLGHCHPAVTRAIAEQAGTLVHVSNLFLNENTPRLAEKLIKRGFDGAVFFANSGAEANEGMIKLARRFGSQTNRSEIIVMSNSFHGRTLATLAATGRPQYRRGFAPDMQGFKYADFNDIESLKNAVGPETCAVMLEPVQGEGGVLPADETWLRQVRALCDEKNLLLLFDEVQCGMGRTGEFFAYQSFGVEPDAVSMAKAIANGIPMGAFIVRRPYAKLLGAGDHGSTFGGTPLAAAAALAVQEVFDREQILENCRRMSAYLTGKLNELIKPYPFAKEIRGRGLMLGIVLDRPAKELMLAARSQGLLVLTAGEVVLRLLPPLNVSKQEIDMAVEKLKAAFAKFAATLQ